VNKGKQRGKRSIKFEGKEDRGGGDLSRGVLSLEENLGQGEKTATLPRSYKGSEKKRRAIFYPLKGS